MARFSTLNSFSLALLALVFAAFIATISVEANPIPNPALAAAPKPSSKKITFTVFAGSKLSGKSKLISNSGCHNHNLGTIGSVRHGTGPYVQIEFYEGKNCSGKINHAMDTSTVKSMGGPYKSNSVKVAKSGKCTNPSICM
ncbi:hypothetical protein BGZ49_008681 [Haplosporangium sp. Z 27]|nr:hypothetical protein BGZ49_008681 [Haplosporangium sp. Z 27]